MNYYFILASEKFLLEEEPLEEVLRERNEYFTKNNKQIDFWLLPSPGFLETNENEIVTLKQKIKGPLVSLVSTDKTFINWLKLRYQNVVSGQFYAPSFSMRNPLDYKLAGN